MFPARPVGVFIAPALGLLTLCSLGVLLAACQDPSGVGLGLLDEDGGDPNVVVAVAEALALNTDEPDLTGGLADGSSPVQTRVLVGAVLDPLYGDVSADAYLDVDQPNALPSDFADGPITSATLRLRRDYVYGDSTATLAVALHEVAADWNPIGAAADTTFEVGERIGAFDVASADSVVALALPEAWVRDNDALLRSDSADTAFDGFRLRLEDGAVGGAVFGFDASDSALRLTTAEDTVDYPVREVFTHVERGAAAPAPADRIVLRDGTGERLGFALPEDAIVDVALARAVLRLAVDRALLEGGGLTRPLPQQLLLYGVGEDGDRFGLASAELSEEEGTYGFASTALTSAVQRGLIGSPLFVRYEIAPAFTPASVSVLPVLTGPAPGEGDTERRPRFVLTVIPAGG